MCDIKDAVVLIVDDCADNLFLMETILVQDGYRVETACSGEQGIQKIHRLVPDLIILDMMMPGMTGAEVIEQLKPFPHLAQIPIIVCTANTCIAKPDLKTVASICYKPIDISDVLTKVNSLVACCGSNNNSTIILDVDEDDPLYLEHQDLLANSDNKFLSPEKLQEQGYKIFGN